MWRNAKYLPHVHVHARDKVIGFIRLLSVCPYKIARC